MYLKIMYPALLRDPFTLLFFLSLLCSCKDKCPYGAENCLSNENVRSEQWLIHTFPDYEDGDDALKNSVLSIRISKKRVMKGFISSGGVDREGAFFKLLHVFSDFRSARNPHASTEYIFFEGTGSLEKDTAGGRLLDETKLFDPQNYTSPTNDLHYQFRHIADELKSYPDPNKFYVIFSDGETSIRSDKRQNKNELTVIKDAVKDMLMANPHLQIGILSLLADFYGEYTYDIGQNANIHCKRYLYAYCFFDKKYLPVFDRLCQLNKDNGGNDFVFNPQLNSADYTTTYNQKIDGQENLAVNNKYAGYSITMNGQDLPYTVENELKLTHLHFSDSLKVLLFKHTQSDTLQFGHKEQVASLSVRSIRKNVLIFPAMQGSALYNAQYVLNYDIPFEQFGASFLISQDTEDNTLPVITALTPADTLKTEGLLDMCRMLLEALQVSGSKPVLNNYFQFSQVK